MNQIYPYFKEDDGYWIRDERSFKIIATGLKLGVAENLVCILNNLASDVRFQQSGANRLALRNAELVKENQELKTFKNDVISVIDNFINEEKKLLQYFKLSKVTALRLGRQRDIITVLENLRKEVNKI